MVGSSNQLGLSLGLLAIPVSLKSDADVVNRLGVERSGQGNLGSRHVNLSFGGEVDLLVGVGHSSSGGLGNVDNSLLTLLYGRYRAIALEVGRQSRNQVLEGGLGLKVSLTLSELTHQ